jgi:hypothetical protein
MLGEVQTLAFKDFEKFYFVGFYFRLRLDRDRDFRFRFWLDRDRL